MEDLVYTREDIEILAQCSSPELGALLEDHDYDPEFLKRLLKRQPKQYKFVYQTEFVDLMDPDYMTNPAIQGFMNWRMKLGR